MVDFALARPEAFFADRFNITSSTIDRLLGSALRGKVDDADIYLEYRIIEELVLEEGVVKKASRHVSQGGGCSRPGRHAHGLRPHRRHLDHEPRRGGPSGAGHRGRCPRLGGG